jgi:hypothetical protein
VKVIALSSMRYPVCSIAIGDNVISAAARDRGVIGGSRRVGNSYRLAFQPEGTQTCEGLT